MEYLPKWLLPQDLLASSNHQRLLSEIHFKSLIKRRMEKASGSDLLRLQSNVKSPASWLGVVPCQQFQTLTPVVFRFALRSRLGLPVTQGGKCAQCPNARDTLGIHSSRCVKVRYPIHNGIRDTLHSMMKEGGLEVSTEDRDLLPGSDDRPADVLWRNGPMGKTWCLDVSVVTYDMPNGIAAVEERKKALYDDRCRLQKLAFKPLIMNSLGAFSSEFDKFLRRVGELRAHRWNSDVHAAVKETREKMQLTAVRLIAAATAGLL